MRPAAVADRSHRGRTPAHHSEDDMMKRCVWTTTRVPPQTSEDQCNQLICISGEGSTAVTGRHGDTDCLVYGVWDKNSGILLKDHNSCRLILYTMTDGRLCIMRRNKLFVCVVWDVWNTAGGVVPPFLFPSRKSWFNCYWSLRGSWRFLPSRGVWRRKSVAVRMS